MTTETIPFHSRAWQDDPEPQDDYDDGDCCEVCGALLEAEPHPQSDATLAELNAAKAEMSGAEEITAAEQRIENERDEAWNKLSAERDDYRRENERLKQARNSMLVDLRAVVANHCKENPYCWETDRARHQMWEIVHAKAAPPVEAPPDIPCPFCDCYTTWFLCQTNDGYQRALFCDGDCGNVTAAHEAKRGAA